MCVCEKSQSQGQCQSGNDNDARQFSQNEQMNEQHDNVPLAAVS